MLLETVEPNDMTLSAIMVAVSEQGRAKGCRVAVLKGSKQ